MVLMLFLSSNSLASSMTARISLTPERTAEKLTNFDFVSLARIRANVVLPEPGGPQKIIENSLSDSIARLSRDPSPSRCFWPMYS
jgi:hypothetical protein